MRETTNQNADDKDGHSQGIPCQALFAVNGATLAVTNHLLFHVPQHHLQDDLFHDLAGHRGDTDHPV